MTALLLPAIVWIVGVTCIVHALFIRWRGWRSGASDRYCPGARHGPTWWRWLVWLFLRSNCGYNLQGCPQQASGATAGATAGVCPECGRAFGASQGLLRGPQRWRGEVVGLCLLGVGAYLAWRPPIKLAAIVAAAPTHVLLKTEAVLGTATPPEVRRENRERVRTQLLSESELVTTVELLVRDLRDDAIIGNAEEAMEELRRLAVVDASPLYAALESDDAQQRRLAGELLRDLRPESTPGDALVKVTIEGLRSDGIRWNAASAADFLARHLDDAIALLIPRLDSSDDQERREVSRLLRQSAPQGALRERLLVGAMRDVAVTEPRSDARNAWQYLVREVGWLRETEMIDRLLAEGDQRQQLIAAALAGFGGMERLRQRALPILIRHLGENDAYADATFALRGLWAFGPAIAPEIRSFLEVEVGPEGTKGRQRERALRFLLRQFERLERGDRPGQPPTTAEHAPWPDWRDDALTSDPSDLSVPGVG